MLTVGDIFPDFNLLALRDGNINSINLDNAFLNINHSSYSGMWRVVFFYPKDFTFVCPTEISAFSDANSEFKNRNTQVLSCSVDSEYVHLAWRRENQMLNDIAFPMLSDIRRELSASLGILDEASGVAKRAVFIVNPEHVIKFVEVTDMNIGRNVSEVIRVLDAIQSGGLCGCNWKKGDAHLSVG